MFVGSRSSIPDVDPVQRGTFAGLASPAMIDYLVELGVTAVELLPIHASVHDRHPTEPRLANYWGYNTIAYFAPDPRLLATNSIAGFKTMVKRAARCRDRSHSRRRLQS